MLEIKPGRIGREQSIRFDPIADQTADTKELPLTAVSDSGLPVRFFVRAGPAKIQGSRLEIGDIPPKTKYPVTIIVVAWQWGRSSDPAVRTATPVERSFRILAAPSSRIDFRVNPLAAPGGDGSEAKPFKELQQVRDAVRRARAAQPSAAITVWLASGVYRMSRSLEFGPEDSGSSEAPVCWRSEKPGEVFFSLARPLDDKRFTSVTDANTLERLAPEARGHVLCLDLDPLEVRHASAFKDHFDAVSDFVKLFVDGEAMPLSRWPNGAQGYTTFERVLDSGDLRGGQPHGGTILYKDERPARWVSALTQGGVWLRGFWRVPWVVEGLRVKSIDASAHTITFAVSTARGIGSKYTPEVHGTRAGGGSENWYALNLIEEIDQPGEWAVDFSSRKLYFWPPSPLEGHQVLLSDESSPVVAFKGASHMELRQVSVLHSLGEGILIQGGEYVRVAGCLIRDIDSCGVRIRGGFRHQVRSCDISRIGKHGIDLTGGDRATLTPGGHQILNNHIHHVGLSGPYPAIRLGEATMEEVVGNHVAHNRIHDCSNAGIRYSGNDNLIEFNEVYRVGLDSSDLGAFYTNSGWTSMGNVLRHNFVHHSENAQAFYLDDGDCGDTVEGNLVYKVQSGVFIGGGHDHRIRNNIIVSSERGIHIDARGKARNYSLSDKRLSQDLASVPYTRLPWSERYPLLSSLTGRDTTVPSDVSIEDNLVIDCAVDCRRSAKAEELVGVHFGLLAKGTLELFRKPEALDFTVVSPEKLKALLPVSPSIPFGPIGLYQDELRASLPERDLHQLQTESTSRQKFDSQTDVDASNRRQGK